MSSPVADIFIQAAELNSNDTLRNGSLVVLPEKRHMIVAGDIHGNRGNLAKIINYAALSPQSNKTLVLQEIIHGPIEQSSGQDRSHELLLRAARLKVANPQNVFFVMGNHDVAQFTGNEITKDGCGVCKKFTESVTAGYGESGTEVMDAIMKFIFSMPLGIQTAGGTFICHSLPSPQRMDCAGIDIFSRPYQHQDFHRGSPVYEWTWGRNQTPEQIDLLAKKLNVGFFVLGHKALPDGMEILSTRAVALACDHERACIFQFDSMSPITGDMETYIKRVRTI